MNSRSSFALAAGFGVLIILIAALGAGAVSKAGAIYNEMRSAEDAYLRTESFRRDIARDMYLADILVRDYLLDPSTVSAETVRQDLLSIRDSLSRRLLDLKSGDPNLQQMQAEVEEYWRSLDPIFEWTEEQKADRRWIFHVRSVLPNRSAVVNLARELARINDENMEEARRRFQASQEVLEQFLLRMMGFALALGTLVAALTIHRVVALEKSHARQRKEIEETQRNLRRLSQRLVQAQEGERRALSRELHDEVGQMMTALGIQLGNLEALRNKDGEAFHSRLEDARRLNGEAMRAIRDLAMGLRPSMLDDLGIEAALQWQGREFSRRTGVPSNVEVSGSLDHLSDAQRTCIYRVVQEALTNCARYANAGRVVVSVAAEEGGVVVIVRDDGVGFNAAAPARGGLGLLGIQERVQALDGKLVVSSEPHKGTTIRVELPVKAAA
jgi:signal transduction histidine kinase